MKDWLKWVLLGLLSIVFGIVVLGAPVVASVTIAVMTGILFLVSGVFQIVGGLTAGGTWNKILTILMGVLLVLLGWIFISNPLEGTISLTMLLIVLFAASGIIRLVFAMQMRGTGLFWPPFLTGILTLVLAIVVWVNAAAEPAALLPLLGVLMGLELIFNGTGLATLGFFRRRLEK